MEDTFSTQECTECHLFFETESVYKNVMSSVIFRFNVTLLSMLFGHLVSQLNRLNQTFFTSFPALSEDIDLYAWILQKDAE